jgi:hypothetical protein
MGSLTQLVLWAIETVFKALAIGVAVVVSLVAGLILALVAWVILHCMAGYGFGFVACLIPSEIIAVIVGYLWYRREWR